MPIFKVEIFQQRSNEIYVEAGSRDEAYEAAENLAVELFPDDTDYELSEVQTVEKNHDVWVGGPDGRWVGYDEFTEQHVLPAEPPPQEEKLFT